MHNLPKIVRILLYIFFGVLVISMIISLLANPVGKRILENQLTELSGGQYNLKLDKLNISLWQQKISLQGIVLNTTPPRQENAPLIMLDAKELTIAGFSWLYLIVDDKLIVDRILLDGLNLHVELKGEAASNNKPFQLEQFDIYPQIKDQFDQVLVNQFQLIDSKLEVQTINSQDTLLFSFQNINLQIKDFLLDDNKLFTDSRTFYAESILLDGGKLKIEQHSNDAWQAGTDHIQLKTEENQLTLFLKSLNFLQKSEGESDTLLLLDLQVFELQDLDVNRLQEKEIAYSKKILISDLYIELPEKVIQPPSEKGKDATEETPNLLLELSLSHYLPPFAKQILLDELEIRRFSIQEGSNLKMGEANLLAKDLTVDENPAFWDNRFLHARALEGDIAEFSLKTGEPVHQLNLSRLLIDVAEGKGDIILEGLNSKPIGDSKNRTRLDAKIDLLSLKGINSQQLTSGTLALDSIKLEAPSWKLYLKEQLVNKEEPQEITNVPFHLEQIDIYPLLQKELKSIQIGDFLVNSSDFRLHSTSLSGTQEFSYQNLALAGKDILIDENKLFSDERAFYTKETDLEVQNFKVISQGQVFFEVETDLIHFNSLEEMGSLSARSIDILQKNRKGADTLISVNLPAFDLEGLDFHRLQKGKTASFNKVLLSHLQYVNLPANGKEKTSAQEDDQNLSFSVADFSLGKNLPDWIAQIIIDDLEVKDARIRHANTFAVEKANLLAKDIKIDQEPAYTENRFFHAISFSQSLENLSLNIGEPVHKIHLSEVLSKVEEGKGSLSIENVFIEPEEDSRMDQWLEAEIDLICLEDFDTRQITSGSFKLDSLLLHDPKVVFHTAEPTAQGDSVKEKVASIPDLYPLIEGVLDSLSINFMKLTGTDIRFAGLGGTYYGMHLSEALVELQDIIIARGNAFLDGRVIHSSNIQLQLPSLVYILPDRVYSLQLTETSLSTKEKTLDIGKLRYGYSGNFMDKLEEEEGNEIYRLLASGLAADEIEWDKLFIGGHLLVNQFVAEDLDVYVYKDFNYPEKEEVKPMPYDLVKNLGIPLSIKEVMVKDMALTYEEMAEGANIAGLVELTEMEVQILNLTNIKSRLVQEPDMTVIGSGKLMGKGVFESTITVPLLDGKKDPRIRGTLDTVDVTELNRIARYNSRIGIETGMIYKAKWDFKTGKDYSYGDFEVSYKGLSIQLSESNSPDTSGILKKVGSFLANKLIVDTNIAEEKTAEPKKVQFEQKRDKKRSFFNFYVKSLLGGLIEAIGVPFQ